MPVTRTPTPEELAEAKRIANEKERVRVKAMVEDYRTRAYNEINRYRMSKGLKPLRIDPKIELTSNGWSAHLLDENIRRGESTFLEHAGAGYLENVAALYVGENFQHHRDDPIKRWKSSPAHNEALLRSNITRMGLGVAFNGYTNTAYVTWRALK